MGLVSNNASNYGFYVYSQVVNDPTNHRYKVNSQAVLQIKSVGLTTVTTDWVAIVINGVSHKVYLAAQYRGVGSHTLYSRSDYFDYSSSARTVTVNANGLIFGKRNPITGNANGPGTCTGYANYESLPAKFPASGIDLVKGAYDHDSIVATCTGIVANQGYEKTVRWYVDGVYKAEDHLANSTVSCSNTFTGLSSGTSHAVTARVLYRYGSVTNYSVELQAKTENWSTAALVVSGGVCSLSAIGKTSAKISLAGLVRNYAYAVDAQVYLKTTLKTTIRMESSTPNMAYTFINLDPGTDYTAQIKIYSTGGALLATYNAISFSTQDLEMFLTENPVLEVTTPALGAVKFAVSNIKRNIPFGVRIEIEFEGITHKMLIANTATTYTYTFTGQRVEWDSANYHVHLINDGDDDGLYTFADSIDLAYVTIDYGEYYRTDLTRTACMVHIPDIVYETTPADLPCVLTFDCNGVSSHEEIVLCTLQDVAIPGDSIEIPITDWDFEESADLTINWKANGLICYEDYYSISGVVLYAGTDVTPEILNLHQTGCTIFLPDAIAKYSPEYTEIEMMDPEDIDANELAVFPGVFDILWHVKIEDANGNLVKYAKVGPEHGETFSYIVTGLKPNTAYTVQLENAPVCRSYDYQAGGYTDSNEVTFTTENYLLTSRVLTVYDGSPLGLTFVMEEILGNSEYPMKFKLYLNDVLRLTTGEVPLDSIIKNRCWMFVDGFSKGTSVTYKVEAIECVTNSIVETFTGAVTTWTEDWFVYIPLSTATDYWLVNVNTLELEEGNDSVTVFYPREHVFPAIQYKVYLRPSKVDYTQPIRFLFERYSQSDTEYIPYDSKTYGSQKRYEMTEAYLPDEDGYVTINKQNFPALGKYCWKPIQLFICDPVTNEIVRSVTNLYLNPFRMLGPTGGDVNVDIPEI